MLSRIARDLYWMGRDIERAQATVRVLEVTHKMNLVHDSVAAATHWIPLYEAFEVPMDEPTEAGLYLHLVLGREHPYSALGCVARARERGRILRDHISEEVWAHLNRYFLGMSETSFESIRRLGRSEFNRQLEVFCDAFHGLADDTMIHGPEWRFLRIGRFLERTEGICRVLEIKRKTLSLTPGEQGRPIDFHQWQGVLRSLSAYEPYRRHHDARIVPARVLDFVLRNPDFPRSLLHCVAELEGLVARESTGSPPQVRLGERIRALRAEIGGMDGRTVLWAGGIEGAVRSLRRHCAEVGDDLEDAFFRCLHRAVPAPTPSARRAEAPQ